MIIYLIIGFLVCMPSVVSSQGQLEDDDLKWLRSRTSISNDSTYLILPISVGGCNKCVLDNQQFIDATKRCQRTRTRFRVVQLVSVSRLLEFRAIASQYEGIEGLYPDLNSQITSRFFVNHKSRKAVLVMQSRMYSIESSEQVYQLLCTRR